MIKICFLQAVQNLLKTTLRKKLKTVVQKLKEKKNF